MESDPDMALPRGDVAALWAKTASRVAAVALVFCGVVLALLLFNASLLKSANPLNHPGIAALADRLQAADQAHRAADVSRVVKEIRDLDASARSQFFKAHAAARRGWVLLLIGAAVFLVSSKAASVLRRKTPMPASAPESVPPAATVSIRTAVAVVMGATALVLLIASYTSPEPPAGPVSGKQARE